MPLNLKPNIISIFILFLLFSCSKKQEITEKDGMVLVEGNDNIKNFWLDKSPVTVAQFAEFVKATNFKTEAERFGDAGVFDFKTGEWSLVKGATWQYPQGPEASAALPNHPVTQVSWNDAVAYCKWAKKRLPKYAEYVLAQKNANPEFDKIYSWGDEYIENGKFKANFWQGAFPYKNTVEDGFLTTSPVGYFGENEIGLNDMGGNVWEWCEEFSDEKPTEKLQCGGSYLCDPMVCHGFKVSRTASSTPETSLMHVGFRCVKAIE